MQLRLSIILGFSLILSCKEKKSTEPPPRQAGVIDAHVHTSASEFARLFDILDEQGIHLALNLSGGWPGGGLAEQIEAGRRSGRVLVACNLPWFAASRTKEFPLLASKLLREAHRMGARALKVSKGLGLGAMKYDRTLLAVDDPWLEPIWETAGELNMPVVIHTGDPKAFWEPPTQENERYEELHAHPNWSNHGIKGLPSFEELLAQLTNTIARYPKTKFVSVHFGNNAENPAWVSKQLSRYPNMYIDIAARLPEFGRHSPKLIREIFIQHADKILFGTDLAVSPRDFLMLGSHGKEPNKREEAKPFFDIHWRYFETKDKEIPSPTPIQGRWTINGIDLPFIVLRKFYFENAMKLFGPWPKPVNHSQTQTATSAR